jgi:hypothetical protein
MWNPCPSLRQSARESSALAKLYDPLGTMSCGAAAECGTSNCDRPGVRGDYRAVRNPQEKPRAAIDQRRAIQAGSMALSKGSPVHAITSNNVLSSRTP